MAYLDENVEIVFLDLEERGEKTILALKTELGSLRVGRANPKILDKVLVNYYGTMTPINQMANITIPEARMIVINVWDASALKNVEKAIIDANLGIFPSNDGKVIRMVFPELNEERRKILAKDIKVLGEGTKVAIRNIRRDILNKLRSFEKEKSITEDDLKIYEKDLDKRVNEIIFEIEKITVEKEAEVMSV
ncbi:MAG: Ribosome-recycling factor [Firmicutes bacterium ADurb.Bin080]|jgi:ribosome recycling factor|nr:ribosome recycling factor [Clostridiales bacterium]OQC16490.1 MAG: Ribosome-recycling factor [Firmicutes bacterium ADurb.Bin080]